ncbi:MAG: hypothetical protein ONA90_01930 [candidate division KSB1 bacterium]|nr:hypothetical protein [candidate division KSB1 bacterium]
MESIAMIKNMSKFTERCQRGFQGFIKQDWQQGIGWLTKSFEQVNVPGVTSWQWNPIEVTNTFENVLDATVKLGQKSSGSGFLANGRLSGAQVSPQSQNFFDNGLNIFQLN